MAGWLPRFFLLPSSAVASGINTTYSSWLLGLMSGLSIFGKVGIGSFADRYSKVTALWLSFTLCGLGHLALWLPGVMLPSTKGSESATTTALFTLFVVYSSLLGSSAISLFPAVVAELFGKDKLASKTGLLNPTLGMSTLAGPSAVYAIIGSGMHKRWMVGVLTAGLFMVAGGTMLLGSDFVSKTTSRRRERDCNADDVVLQ